MNAKNLCRCCGKNKTVCKSSVEDANNMLQAVTDNDLNKIKFLIGEGKSPNIHNAKGYTPLYQAVSQKRTDIVEYLLTLPEINLEQYTSFYKTPLLLSVELKNPQIAKMLIKKGANLNVTDIEGDTILHRAVFSHSPESIRFILTKEFDINVTNKYGETPLHIAASCNDFELVSMLLYYNADANIMDKYSYTPFMRTLDYNYDENLQRELFKYECDYNRETSGFGNTLSLAVHCGSPLIIDLIEKGADVNYYCDNMDKTMLAWILERCDQEIFFYVFPLINLSILTECEESIFISYLECNYNKEEWLKALFLILESDVLIELIDHYILTCENGLFENFAKAFREKNISEDEFVRFVEICLCSGADVLFEDIKTVYEVYSNNKALPHLLNMKIKNLPDFNYSLPFIFSSFNKNFARALHKYYKWDNSKASHVPKLLELSRNKAIVAICTKYNINSSHWYYYILRRLRHLNIIPGMIYDYLTFRYDLIREI